MSPVTDNLEEDTADPLMQVLVVANRLPFCRMPGAAPTNGNRVPEDSFPL